MDGRSGGWWERFGRWFRQHRARIEILAIGGVAIGGIVCMALTVLVIIVAGR